MSNNAIPKDRLAVSVSEAARMTTLSRGTIRSYARNGRIKAVKVGRRTLVPVTTLEELIREGVEPRKAA
jgi:excisionase family DNA binding protein